MPVGPGEVPRHVDRLADGDIGEITVAVRRDDALDASAERENRDRSPVGILQYVGQLSRRLRNPWFPSRGQER